jgi:hypothetical protein
VGYQAWDGGSNNLLAVIFKCENAQTGFLMLVRDPFELWEDAEPLSFDSLSAKDIAMISSLRPSVNWDLIPLDPAAR